MKKTLSRTITLLLAMMVVLAMSTSVFATSVTKSGALSKALSNANLTKSEVRAVEVEKEHGIYEIEFMRKSNGAEYSYDISASSGKILEKAVDYNRSYKKHVKNKIGKTAAMKKAAKASGVNYSVVKKGRCIYDEGKYEVKFKSSTRRYDYEIKASNGKVLEFEWELLR